MLFISRICIKSNMKTTCITDIVSILIGLQETNVILNV